MLLSGNRFLSCFRPGIILNPKLTAEALDALFATFNPASAGKIFIGGNPGEAASDRSIATKRDWRVSLRY